MGSICGSISGRARVSTAGIHDTGNVLSELVSPQSARARNETTCRALVALLDENATLREQLVAYMDVQVPPYFQGYIGTLDPLALKVLSFWFGMDYDGATITPEAYHLWFGKSSETDLEISMMFEVYLDKAAAGMYDHWMATPLGVVALLMLMDQFPRNIYRNTARAFAYDWKAIIVTQQALAQGHDDLLTDLEKVWLYLVLTHTEDITTQERCVALATAKLVKMETGFQKMWNLIFQKHLVVIEKFGRFPHRNSVLMRPSTAEEEKFVNDPSYRFDLPVKLEVDKHTGHANFIFISDDAKEMQSFSSSQTVTDMINALPSLDLEVSKQLRLNRRLGANHASWCAGPGVPLITPCSKTLSTFT
jgi:uncharacterized protein (DUF924 family)